MQNRSSRLLSIFIVLLLFICGGCGGDAVDFTGTWDGSITKLDNDCPFTVNQNLGTIFPMQITEDSAGVFTVAAANGDVAVGGQGPGESISFTAKSNSFGSYGSSAPYVCTVSPYTVGYLTQEDNTARVHISVTFSNCAVSGQSASVSSCGITYSGDATRR